MKKLIAYFSGVAVLLSMTVSSAFAILPPVTPVTPIIPIDCHSLQSCGVYVDDSAAPGGDGSKTLPFQKITDAVNYLKNPANTDYNTIYVGEGTYNAETLPWSFDGASYSKSVRMYGGYNSVFSASTPGTSVIRANLAAGVLSLKSVGGVVSGFDISGATNSVIVVQNEGATTLDVAINNNTIHTNTMDSTVVMPILLAGSNTATVNNNLINTNSVTNGLITNYRGKVTVYDNRYFGNSGGSLKCSDGALVYNNYILADVADWIVIAGGSCTLEYNTLARNDINSGTDHGVVVLQNNANMVANNMIAYNAGDDTVVHISGDTSTFQYNGFFANSNDPTLIDNNISCDPKFAAGGSNPTDHKLGAGSTCIDKGIDTTGITNDYFGDSRPLDGDGNGAAKFDLGAFEGPVVLPPPPTPPTPPSPPASTCSGFTDVPDTHPDCAAITYVKSIGAMTGNPDGTFAPNSLLQRDQVAKIVLATFSKYVDGTNYCSGTNPFPDVTASDWSFQYICRGKGLGIITGYLSGSDAGFYRPSRSVNRVEFLALLLRNLSDPMPATSSSSYSDVATGQWFSGYAKYSYDNGLFVLPNLFPTQATSRLEVAEVIYRLHTLGKI